MPDREKSKILLIDDDTNLLVTLSDFLSFEGYEVVTADSGEEGLKRLADMMPDLIILDMSMPGMGGVGFLREISTDDGKPQHPVLVLTARANMAEFFADADVDGFVAKPCNPEDLLMEVSRIIFLRKGAREQDAAREEGAKKTALIGEDEPQVIDDLVQAFGRAGYIVDTVTDGPEILEKAITQRPDVIVVKRVLTGMNGDAVAGVLKEMPNTQSIPVVLYDHGNEEDPESKFTRPGTGIKKFVRSQDAGNLVAAASELVGE